MSEDNSTTETNNVEVPDIGEATSLKNLLETKAKALEEADKTFLSMKNGKKFNRGDVMKVLTNLRQVVRVHERLSDLTIQDLMIVDQRFNHLEQQLFQLIQQMSTTSTLLINKKVITKEEIKETWEKEVKPKVEEKVRAAQEAANKGQPEPSRLLAPDGTPADMAPVIIPAH